MGEVYRARDTKLGRNVAIKVLPDTVSHDTGRLARFEREAKTLAALNHPNIAHIHGFEDSTGVSALVMELVEGPTLADRIAQGPIPIDEALPIANQIAEALEAAHEQGVVHRDLKPANIKVRDDGTVKVLDFGLAKALGPAATSNPSVTQSPTITTPAMMTGVGMILGTAAYMSPEQAKGRPADKRSDVWAFGCVLYEMLTGKRAFEGDDVSETLAAVLRGEPDWNALPASTPMSVTRLLHRTLAKDRRRRVADIADARLDLDDAADVHTSDVSPPLEWRRWRAAAVFASAIGVFSLSAAIVMGFIGWNRAPVVRQAVQFTIAPPEGWTVGFDFLNGSGAVNVPIAVSPDGRHIALVGINKEGRTRLWIRSLDALTPRELAGSDGATSPFWSPDSRFVAFYADGKLKKIDIAGGPPVELCSISSFNSGTWGSQGVIFFSRAGGDGGGLLKIPQSGGTPTPATTLANGQVAHFRPVFLPDGVHFLYRATSQTGGGGIFIESLNSKGPQRLFEEGIGNAIYSRGHLLFVRNATLMAQRFDVRRLALVGEASPVADHIQTNGSVAPVGSVSAGDNGVLAYQAGASEELGTQLTWLDRSGNAVGTVGPRRNYLDVEVSPDGKQASVSLPRVANGGRDVWLIDLVRGVSTRFTFQPGATQTSVWSPDGKRVVFNAMIRGALELFQKPMTGGAEEPFPSDGISKAPWSWSPDGKYIVYSNLIIQGGSVSNLWVLPLSGDRKPFRFLPSSYNQLYGRVSPDSHWIAFASDESNQRQVYITSFPDASRAKHQVSVSGGTEPRWRGDGKEIFFVNGNTLLSASVDASATGLQIGVPKPLFQFRNTGIPRSNYGLRPDGQQFLFNVRAEERSSAPITVVMNWDVERE